MPPEELQVISPKLSQAISFMVECGSQIFKVSSSNGAVGLALSTKIRIFPEYVYTCMLCYFLDSERTSSRHCQLLAGNGNT